MKSISCIVWILGALLVIATLDALPDPPAVNPGTVVCKVLRVHDLSCGKDPQSCDSVNTAYSFPVSFIVADTCEAPRPSEQMVLTGHVADSSPPSTPFFQS